MEKIRMSSIIKNSLSSLKSIFRLRKDKKSITEHLVSSMGITHLVIMFLAIPSKLILSLYFMSSGWVSTLQNFIGIFSGREFTSLGALNRTQTLTIILGTAYALYHIIIILFFLLVILVIRKGASISTYFLGLFSILILIFYTIMGFNFCWT